MTELDGRQLFQKGPKFLYLQCILPVCQTVQFISEKSYQSQKLICKQALTLQIYIQILKMFFPDTHF